MKKLVLVLIAALSLSAPAMAEDDGLNTTYWIIGGEQREVAAIEAVESRYTHYARIESNGKFSFIKAIGCDERPASSGLRESVNGKRITFTSMCDSDGYSTKWATTEEDNQYIINEFKTKGTVVVQRDIFFTENFTNVYNELFKNK